MKKFFPVFLAFFFIFATGAEASNRRKCIKSGNTWVITPSGKKFCLKKMNKTNRDTGPNDQITALRRRKCLKSGGIWMVSSVGKFCLKKLDHLDS